MSKERVFRFFLTFLTILIGIVIVFFILFTDNIEAKSSKEPTIKATPGNNIWTAPAGDYGEHGEGVESSESNSTEEVPASTDPNDGQWHPDHDPWHGDLPPLDHDPWPDDSLTEDD
jgi:hypothetical protein